MPSIFTPNRPQIESEKPVTSTPFLTDIQRRITNVVFDTHNRVSGIMGWPGRIMKNIKDKISRLIPEFLKPSQKAEDPLEDTPNALEIPSQEHHQVELQNEASPSQSEIAEGGEVLETPLGSERYQGALNAERVHQTQLYRFTDIYQNYRSSFGLSHLSVNDTARGEFKSLNQLAGEVAHMQVLQKNVHHSDEAFREKNGIGGEIITSGFSTPEEALENFINSPDHEPLLMSKSYREMGMAIREGEIEEKDDHGKVISRQPVYYLVVVYGQEGEPVPKGEEIPRGEIPGDMRPKKMPEWNYVNEAILDRPWLQAAFDAFEEECASQNQKIVISYHKELTETAPEDPEKKKRFEKERMKGSFYISLSQGSKSENYKVSDNPPVLLRAARKGEELNVVPVRFEELMKDFLEIPNHSSVTKMSEIIAERNKRLDDQKTPPDEIDF